VTLRFLVIDDSPGMRDALAEGLQTSLDADAAVAASGEEGLARLDADHIDVVLLDVRLPGLDGAAVCGRIVARDNPPAVIMLSAYGHEEYAEHAAAAGAAAFVQKSGGLSPILDAVMQLVQDRT
jgi:DNA-binding NarL/FixJ family response regulator